MNNWDRSNLEFLLTASRQVLNEWHAQADEDDHAYAMELLRMARTELEMQALDLLEQDTEQDLSAAQSILSRFTL
jgi:hypothetical protein